MTPIDVARMAPRSTRLLADFSGFYAEQAERVLTYLARRCLDPEIAVDLMAETFAQALVCRHRFRGTSDAEAEAWLFGIARNQLASYFRRGKAERKAVDRLRMQVPDVDYDDRARIEELADLDRMRDTVVEHFQALSAEQRDALRLRVIDGVPYSEVARRLAVSEDAARARVSRALRQLAAFLDKPVMAKGAAAK